MNDKLTIIKIGGSVITDKSKPLSVDKKLIRSLACEMDLIKKKKTIIVHGGGSFGHPIAKKYMIAEGLKNAAQIPGVAETSEAMLTLNKIIVDIFLQEKFPVISFSPHDIFITKRGRIYRSFIQPLTSILEIGLIPILFGDVVYDIIQGAAILSGDQIISYLSTKLETERIILGTDTDGIYSADPKKSQSARLIPEITPENYRKILINLRTSAANSIDVTGGMYGKVKELVKVAKHGIDIYIINAKKPGNLNRILNGFEIVCTRFKDWKTNNN
ncbi:MAG: isopentenyl phosphate kinase [Candidatus Odinarchaeota archaeon]